MSARVLLVTGSRALSDTPQAEAWARAELAKHISDDLVTVVSGDARGPDEWVHQLARGMWHARWTLGGSVDAILLNEWWSEARWLPLGTPAPHTNEAWKARALARNKAMVEHTARYDHSTVKVVALKAPWSRTDGTGHTAGLAARHGLPVEVLTCPEEYGPRGSR